MLIRRVLLTFAGTAGLCTLAQANCGSAICLLNTDWATQGVWTQPGLRADLRYEVVRQDQLRQGTRKVGADAVDEEVVPQRTRDGNWLASFDYAFDERWGLGVSLPFVRREHRQLTRADTPGDADRFDAFHLDGLGDARVTGRWQAWSQADAHHGAGAAGLSFGVKLPTGRDTVSAPDGERAEPGLQPGTGTTDALLGAWYHRQLVSGWSTYARLQVQHALNSADDYRPGDKLGGDLGLRYPVSDALALQLQLNALYTRRSRGARAEPENTGGTLVTLSPGVSWTVGDATQLYAWYQRPVYQHVNGVQLSTRDAFVLGLSQRF